VTGIFAYLTICSIRNSVRVKVRRLRQPRYILIALAFVVYVGSLMFGRPSSGSMGFIGVEGLRARLIATAVATLLLGTSWIFSAGAALRFTSAEIQFLFTAPIARRELITYKVWRLLLSAAASGVFFAVLVGPPRLVPGLFFAVKAAIVMAILALYNASVAMVRSGPRRRGTMAAAWLLTPVAGAALVFVAFSSPSQLVAVLAVGLLMIGSNAALIVRSDAAFEEAASEAADKLTRAVTAGHFIAPSTSRSRSTPFSLSPRGPVEPAILWKNWLLIGRASRQTLLASAIVLGSLLAVSVGVVAWDGAYESDMIGDLSIFFVAITVLLGPAMLRIDLRQDLGHLALIKTWPVRGAAVLRGEVLAPAIVLSLVTAVAVMIGSIFAPSLFFVDDPGTGSRAIFALSALLVLTATIVAELVVHNALAVSFPAWVEIKATPDGSAAMEMNVRMMIVMYGAMLLLAVVLIVPVAGAFAAYYLADGLLIPAATFAALLMGECLAATEIIGRILDRTDLQDVAVAA
jgi:hypothetical protein